MFQELLCLRLELQLVRKLPPFSCLDSLSGIWKQNCFPGHHKTANSYCFSLSRFSPYFLFAVSSHLSHATETRLNNSSSTFPLKAMKWTSITQSYYFITFVPRLKAGQWNVVRIEWLSLTPKATTCLDKGLEQRGVKEYFFQLPCFSFNARFNSTLIPQFILLFILLSITLFFNQISMPTDCNI